MYTLDSNLIPRARAPRRERASFPDMHFSRHEVVFAIRSNCKMSIRDLVKLFRTRLNTRAAKDEFMQTVKEVAQVTKIVELRSSYDAEEKRARTDAS